MLSRKLPLEDGGGGDFFQAGQRQIFETGGKGLVIGGKHDDAIGPHHVDDGPQQARVVLEDVEGQVLAARGAVGGRVHHGQVETGAAVPCRDLLGPGRSGCFTASYR